MCFSLDSVPDEQLTLDGAWMDYSDKNFPEPAQLKCFRPVEGESVLPTGPPDSITSLAMRAQRRRSWSETNGLRVSLLVTVCICICVCTSGVLCKQGGFFEVSHSPYCKLGIFPMKKWRWVE